MQEDDYDDEYIEESEDESEEYPYDESEWSWDDFDDNLEGLDDAEDSSYE